MPFARRTPPARRPRETEMPRTRRGRSRTTAALEGRRMARTVAADSRASDPSCTSAAALESKAVSRAGRASPDSALARLSRAEAQRTPTDLWCAISAALNLPLRLEFGRDALQEPTDAGHLRIQELMLRLAKQLGIARFFELPTRPIEPSMSVDVGWRDDTRRVLLLNECWNTFGSINAAVRSTHRKLAEAGSAGGGDR